MHPSWMVIMAMDPAAIMVSAAGMSLQFVKLQAKSSVESLK